MKKDEPKHGGIFEEFRARQKRLRAASEHPRKRRKHPKKPRAPGSERSTISRRVPPKKDRKRSSKRRRSSGKHDRSARRIMGRKHTSSKGLDSGLRGESLPKSKGRSVRPKRNTKSKMVENTLEAKKRPLVPLLRVNATLPLVVLAWWRA